MLVNKTLWGLTNCCEINISKLDFYNTSGVHLNLWPRYPSKEQAWSLQRWASKIGNIPKIIIIVILVNFLVIVELAVALFEISFIFSVRKQTDSRLRSAVHSQDTKTKVNHILEDKKKAYHNHQYQPSEPWCCDNPLLHITWMRSERPICPHTLYISDLWGRDS